MTSDIATKNSADKSNVEGLISVNSLSDKIWAKLAPKPEFVLKFKGEIVCDVQQKFDQPVGP
jgi:hypothetical protein